MTYTARADGTATGYSRRGEPQPEIERARELGLASGLNFVRCSCGWSTAKERRDEAVAAADVHGLTHGRD